MRRQEITKRLVTEPNLKLEERDALTRELRELVASQASQEERQNFVDMPIVDIRDAVGVQAPELTPVLRQKWNEDTEAELLAGLHDGGVPVATTRAFYDWYTGVFAGALGDSANLDIATVEADFRALAKRHGVKDAVVDALVKAQKAKLS